MVTVWWNGHPSPIPNQFSSHPAMSYIPLLILLLIPCIGLCIIGYRKPELFASDAFPSTKMWLLLSIMAYGAAISLAVFTPSRWTILVNLSLLIHAAAYFFYALALGSLLELLASQNMKKAEGRKPQSPTLR